MKTTLIREAILVFMGFCAVLPCHGQDDSTLGPGGSPSVDAKVPLAPVKPLGEEASRDFTDTSGKKINGTLRAFEAGETVVIAHPDETLAKFPYASFIPDDQAYIKTWYLDKILPQGKSLTFTSNPVVGEPQALPNGRSGMMTAPSAQDCYYELSIKNGSPFKIESARVEYATFLKTGSFLRSGPSIFYEPVTIESGKALSFNTGMVRVYQSSRMAENKATAADLAQMPVEEREAYRKKMEKAQNSGSSLGGLWVRVYLQGRLIGEYSDPLDLSKTKEWPSKEPIAHPGRALPPLSANPTAALFPPRSGNPTAGSLPPTKAILDFDQPHTFADSKGQSVTGTLRSIEAGGIVVVATEDKKLLKVQIDHLSSEDQTYVRRWYVEKVLSLQRTLEVKFTRSNEGSSAGQSSSGAVGFNPGRTRVQMVGYDIALKNKGPLPLDELSVQAYLFKKRDNGDYETISSPRPCAPIAAGATTTVSTSLIPIQSSTGSVSEVGDTKYITASTRESLSGVWVRVYDGATLIAEASDPAAIMQNESWPSNRPLHTQRPIMPSGAR